MAAADIGLDRQFAHVVHLHLTSQALHLFLFGKAPQQVGGPGLGRRIVAQQQARLHQRGFQVAFAPRHRRLARAGTARIRIVAGLFQRQRRLEFGDGVTGLVASLGDHAHQVAQLNVARRFLGNAFGAAFGLVDIAGIQADLGGGDLGGQAVMIGQGFVQPLQPDPLALLVGQLVGEREGLFPLAQRGMGVKLRQPGFERGRPTLRHLGVQVAGAFGLAEIEAGIGGGRDGIGRRLGALLHHGVELRQRIYHAQSLAQCRDPVPARLAHVVGSLSAQRSPLADQPFQLRDGAVGFGVFGLFTAARHIGPAHVHGGGPAPQAPVVVGRHTAGRGCFGQAQGLLGRPQFRHHQDTASMHVAAVGLDGEHPVVLRQRRRVFFSPLMNRGTDQANFGIIGIPRLDFRHDRLGLFHLAGIQQELARPMPKGCTVALRTQPIR